MEQEIPSIEEVARFHGHLCPGLALGYRAAETALKWLRGHRAVDEEVVVVAETRACSVDAVQYLLGATAGKGNLFVRDYGKHVFLVATRENPIGLRLAARPKGRWRREGETRQATIERLLHIPEEELFDIREEVAPIPPPAEVLDSIVCDACGEGAMENRVRHYHGKTLCIPCYRQAVPEGAE